MFVCNSHPSAGRWKSLSCTRRWFTHWTHARLPDPHHLLHQIRLARTSNVYSGSLQRLTTTRQFQACFFCQHPPQHSIAMFVALESWQVTRVDPEEKQGEHPLDYLTISHSFFFGVPWGSIVMWILGAGWGWQRFWTPVSNPQWRNLWNGCFVCDFDLSNGLSMMILLLRFT